MATLVPFTTQVTQQVEEVVASFGGLAFTSDSEGFPVQVALAQISSLHTAALYVVSVRPIAGTNRIRVELNRTLSGDDPLYPNGTRFANMALLVEQPPPG